MPNGYSPDVESISSPVTASQTNFAVGKPFPITAGGSLHFVVKLTCSAVTVGTAITAKLQTSINGDWVDSKTVSVTANGNFYIKLLAEAAADQTYLPLLSLGRVVVTTGSGDAVTVDSISILQDQ